MSINDETNVFVVGPAATGNSFIGRKQDLLRIETVFNKVSAAYHLFGVTRIGKTSLAAEMVSRHQNAEKRIIIELTMSEYDNSISFWYDLIDKLKEGIHDSGINNDSLKGYFNDIGNTAFDIPVGWLSVIKEKLKRILKKLGKDYGYRVVLIIDEFDYCTDVFKDSVPDYQVLRTLYSKPDCFTNGIVISRMALQDIEKRCPNISSFQGVFNEVHLKAFSDEDMEAFYSKLNDCGVSITDDGCNKLEYYTGRLPMLCCMLANNMVINKASQLAYDGDAIRKLFIEHQPKTEQYYADLKDRLEADDLLEVAMYLAFGMQIPVMSSRRISNLTTYGIIVLDKLDKEKDGNGYYVFSKDFMDYLKYVPLSLPVWETITLSEKKIKDIFSKEYKKLSEIRYSEFGGKDKYSFENVIDGLYPELSLDWNQIRSYGRNSSSYMQNPSILDVLTLPYIISVINRQWSTKFYRFFGSDDWKDKLQKISNLRNPIAHAHIDYISPDALAEGLSCCNEVIRLP